MDSQIIRTISDLIIIYPELKIILTNILLRQAKNVGDSVNEKNILCMEISSIRIELDSIIKELNSLLTHK